MVPIVIPLPHRTGPAGGRLQLYASQALGGGDGSRRRLITCIILHHRGEPDSPCLAGKGLPIPLPPSVHINAHALGGHPGTMGRGCSAPIAACARAGRRPEALFPSAC